MSERAPVHTPAPIEPLDEYNRELLANVHPPDWVNPEPAPRYQPGGDRRRHGRPGYRRRRGGARRQGRADRAAPDGRRLPERRLRPLEGGHPRRPGLAGGARAARALRRAASPTAQRRRLRRRHGAHAPAARRHQRRSTAPRASRAWASTSSWATAASPGRTTIEVGGKRLRFRRAVIATGARAAVPPIPGLAEAGYLTNETVFSLTELPGAWR